MTTHRSRRLPSLALHALVLAGPRIIYAGGMTVRHKTAFVEPLRARRGGAPDDFVLSARDSIGKVTLRAIWRNPCSVADAEPTIIASHLPPHLWTVLAQSSTRQGNTVVEQRGGFRGLSSTDVVATDPVPDRRGPGGLLRISSRPGTCLGRSYLSPV